MRNQIDRLLREHVSVFGRILACVSFCGTSAFAQTEPTSTDDLVALATKKFWVVLPEGKALALRVFFQNIQEGKTVDLTPKTVGLGDAREARILTEPAYGDLWGDDRCIEAGWLNWLCTDVEAVKKVSSRGIQITGARISGKVDLSWSKLDFPIVFYRCAFTKDLVLSRASVRGLQLQDTQLKSLLADGLSVERDFGLDGQCVTRGFVWLREANISGTLTLGGHIFGNGVNAINLQLAKIGGDVLLNDRFRAEGLVSLLDASVTGAVRCDHGSLSNPGNIALNLDGAKVGSVFLGNQFDAQGAVELPEITISGILDCENGYFNNPDGTAIDLYGAKTGSVFMGQGFQARGEVRLELATIDGLFNCENGLFINPRGMAINLEGARTGTILLRKDPGTSGNDRFESEGEISLLNAVIQGGLECSGGKFINPGKLALNAFGTKSNSIQLNAGFAAQGVISIEDAIIDGALNCSGGHFYNAGRVALDAQGIKSGAVLMSNGFEAQGLVSLVNAEIAGNLDCDGGHFSNPKEVALAAWRIKANAVFMNNRFDAQGLVSLQEATVAGIVDCQNAHFSNPGGVSLTLEAAKTGSVLLRKDLTIPGNETFRAEGEILLEDAVVNGAVECDNGRFSNKGAVALNFQGGKSQNVYLRNGFEAFGEVTLQGAIVDQQVDCSKGHFSNPGRLALSLEAVKAGAVFLRRDSETSGSQTFEASGQVRLVDATIDESLDCSGGNFKDAASTLNAIRANIKGGVYLEGITTTGNISFQDSQIGNEFCLWGNKWGERSVLDLSHATLKTLYNDVSGWPAPNNLRLHALIFEDLHKLADLDSFTQRRWIRLQPEDTFRAQPFEQLAKVFRAMGREEEATDTMIAKNEEYGKSLSPDFSNIFWYQLFGRLIDFGYHPWKAFIVSAVLVLVGTIFFHLGYCWNLVTPTNKDAYKKSEGESEDKLSLENLSSLYPRFSSFVYSLETFVPLLKLWMGDYWAPNATRSYCPDPQRPWLEITGSQLRWYLWFHIAAGWVLTTLWVGGLTGLIKT